MFKKRRVGGDGYRETSTHHPLQQLSPVLTSPCWPSIQISTVTAFLGTKRCVILLLPRLLHDFLAQCLEGEKRHVSQFHVKWSFYTVLFIYAHDT